MSIFSDRINGIMSKRHISQKQLANWANVTESAMSYYVNGARTPRIQVISRLAGLLGVTTDYLLGADVPEKENESQFQYIQRNLAKLNPEQLSKATKILELVLMMFLHQKKVLQIQAKLLFLMNVIPLQRNTASIQTTVKIIQLMHKVPLIRF